jgi:hypothetical protein
MTITADYLQQLLNASGVTGALAHELLAARRRIEQLEERLAVPVRLPYYSSSPVCEMESGYAAGVSDSKQAIRQAGYPIAGDD